MTSYVVYKHFSSSWLAIARRNTGKVAWQSYSAYLLQWLEFAGPNSPEHLPIKSFTALSEAIAYIKKTPLRETLTKKQNAG